MTIQAESVSSPRERNLSDGRFGTYKSLIQLTKPGVSRLVMISMLCGALIAPGAVDFVRLAIALFSTALVVAGANALNMYLERDIDALMERTRSRPLPTGRIAPELALRFGVALALIGVFALAVCVGALPASLAALALLSYVLAYTPLKRVTPLALHIGALPGAIPPLIGWSSVTGSLDQRALSVFLILFFWQLPHFIAISVFRRDEYARAGLRVLSVARGVAGAKRAIVVYSALLVLVSFVPPLTGLGTTLYLSLAALSGAGFFAAALLGLRASAGSEWARRLFFVSMPYLVVLLGGLVLSAV